MNCSMIISPGFSGSRAHAVPLSRTVSSESPVKPEGALQEPGVSCGAVCIVAVSLLWCLSGSAAMGFQEIPTLSESVGELRERLKTGSAEEQIEAVVRLGSLGPYAFSAVDDLAGLLESDNPAVRYECISALGEIGPLAHDAAGGLTQILSGDSALYQTAALESLRRIGTVSKEANVQIRRLCGSSDAAVATSAVRCLVAVDGTESNTVTNAIPGLVNALGDDRAAVRNEAAITLMEVGGPVVPVVTNQLSNSEPLVRLKACEVLGGVGAQASSSVAKLVERLKDDDELVVRAAAQALGSIQSNPEEVLPALNELLQRKSTGVRIAAVRAIGDFGPVGKGSAQLVLPFLSDSNAILRASAADTLGRTGTDQPDVISGLVGALSDSSGGVTVKAANALSQIGAAAVPALVQKLADEGYRGLIVEILGEMGAGAESAVPALVTLIGTQPADKELQREIFITLASIGPAASAATPAMMKILQDPAAEDAHAGAVYVLARAGEQKAVPAMKQLIASGKNERAVRAAAWALVMLQPTNPENAAIAIPHLLVAAGSENELARREAISALTLLGPAAKAAQSTLLEHAASDPVAAVRSGSLHALGEIRAPAEQALPIAMASLEDPDATVRNAARYLLGRIGREAMSAEPKLKETLRRGNDFERILSAWALVQISPSPETFQAAVPLMLLALHHERPQVRAEAATTLGVIGRDVKEVPAALESALKDGNPAVEEAARKALTLLKNER